MPKRSWRSRILFLLITPITFPVLWLAFAYPFRVIDMAVASIVTPGLISAIGGIGGLLVSVVLHVKMWRTFRAADTSEGG